MIPANTQSKLQNRGYRSFSVPVQAYFALKLSFFHSNFAHLLWQAVHHIHQSGRLLSLRNVSAAMRTVSSDFPSALNPAWWSFQYYWYPPLSVVCTAFFLSHLTGHYLSINHRTLMPRFQSQSTSTIWRLDNQHHLFPSR